MDKKEKDNAKRPVTKQEKGNSSKTNTPFASNEHSKVGAQGIGTIIAGAALIFEVFTHILSSIVDSCKCKIALGINNYTDDNLGMPKFYIKDGYINKVSLDIKKEEAGFASISGDNKSSGVISFLIEDTTYRLAIYWNMQHTITGYPPKSFFKVAIIPPNIPTDKALYEDMDKDYENKTTGKKALPKEGAHSWKSKIIVSKDDKKIKINYELLGTMGTSCESALNISIKKVGEEETNEDNHPLAGLYSLQNKANGEYRTNRATKMSKKYKEPECLFLLEEQTTKDIYAIRNMQNKKYFDCSIRTMSGEIKDECQQWRFKSVKKGEENEHYIQNVKNREHMTKKASQLSKNTGKDEIYILKKRDRS